MADLIFLGVLISLFFGAICSKMAEKRGRGEICWGVLGFLFWVSLIPMIVLSFMKVEKVK